jgi:small GTP-binding protein
MRAYYRGLAKEKELPLREAKILLVGDGGAGKTSLVKCLLGGGYDPNESQTHGINIDAWTVKDGENEIKAHLWDFGGQEIMHATHQFFLSKRSLYVLVLDGRRDEKTEYWLKHIESFGGDSPVLVTLNKVDQNPGHDVNRNFLRQKYQNIKGFFCLSCADKKGLPAFCAALQEELAKVELIHTTWPESWFAIKKELEHMSRHFINRRQYEKICRKAKIRDKTNRDVLLEFLHDLGVVLHFKDFELQDTHVLEPEWVTGAFYKIVNSPELAQNQGILELSMLEIILKKKDEKDYDYPPDQYRFIIGLIEKFELCYPLEKGKSVLVPDLLPVQEPEIDLDYDNALRFIVDYEFLPRSVMPRFIVNMYRDIEDDLQWRTGVVLEGRDFEGRALVRADNEARRIYIYVTGTRKRDYFAALLLTLRRINGSFEKLKTKELIPMPDDPEITVSYNHLLVLEEESTTRFIPDGSRKKYNVADLLGTVRTGENLEEAILNLLQKLADKTDTVESLVKKAQNRDTLLLQPNFMGLGIDLKGLAKKTLSLFHKKKK